jgi:uncharacterized protein (DUF427 family)
MSSREHRLLPTDRRIRAMFGGEVIADTPSGWLGFGGYKPPLYELGTWWFERERVRTELLAPSDHRSVCDVRGPASYWDIVVGDRRAAHAAYAYEQAPAGWEALRGLITFRFNDIDHWYEEEQEVFVHPRGPMHRVDALRSSRHVQVSLDGVPLADTRRPVALFETGMPARWYIPRADVALEHLTDSPTRTQCPYKGVAEYYSVTAGEHTIPDLAWTYTFPVVECRRIAQHVCFFSERVDITIDDEPQSRPVTKWEHEIPDRDVL